MGVGGKKRKKKPPLGINAAAKSRREEAKLVQKTRFSYF